MRASRKLILIASLPLWALNVTGIARADIVLSSIPNQTAVEGVASSFNLGSFTSTDVGPWDVTAFWDDGTLSSFAVSQPGPLTAMHTFTEEAFVPSATVVVSDTSNLVGVHSSFSVNVSDTAVLANGMTITGSAGVPIGFPFAIPIASFIDPGGAEPNLSDSFGTVTDHYSVASIDWGDGSAVNNFGSLIDYSGVPGSTTDPFTIRGSHEYLANGKFTITTTIDHEGADTTVTSTAIIGRSAVPEPSSLLLLGSMLAAIGALPKNF